MAGTGPNCWIQMVAVPFKSIDGGHRSELPDMLAGRHSCFGEQHQSVWKKAFQVFTASTDPVIREKAVRALPRCYMELVPDFLIGLLKDKALAVRRASWDLTLQVICYHYGCEGFASRADHGVMAFYERFSENPETVDKESEDAIKLARAETLAQAYTAWHRAMSEDNSGKNHLIKAMAIYLTDARPEHMAGLVPGFEKDQFTAIWEKQYGRFSMNLLVSRLPWPESKSVVQKIMSDPYPYGILANALNRADPGLAGFVMTDEYVLKNLKKAGSEARQIWAEALMAPADENAVSLLRPEERSGRLAGKLIDSDAPFLKSIGAAAARKHPDISKDRLSPLCSAPNPWVRHAAISAVGARVRDQQTREAILGPHVDDSHPEVARLAVQLLLTENVRKKAGYYGEQPLFKYEDIELAPGRYQEEPVRRPIFAIDRKPGFLNSLEAAYKASAAGTDSSIKPVIALLQAQYGKFDALTIEIEKWRRKEPQPAPGRALLTGIALSRNPDYIADLRPYVEQATDAYDLRAVLSAIRRIRGNEARQMRRTLNQRIRQYGR